MNERPLVGVTTYLERAQMGVWDTRAVYLPHAYLAPLTAAGATVVALPPQPASLSDADALLATLDALVIAGGYDVDPARYGSEPHPTSDAPRSDRDEWELALVDAARRADMPLLGICRGAQVLNVSRGGTLHQHLPDVVGHTQHQGEHGVFSHVNVDVVAGSAIAALHHDSPAVPVYHHQAIDALGEGLVVTARSADGVVEAIEDPNLTFCVATQWHPEQDADSARLFAGFVAAAAGFRRRRIAPV